MKLAIIGSRSLTVNLEKYITEDVTEIVSGGAEGIDMLAKQYAIAHNIKLTEFFPKYEKYKRNAPLVRNREIVDYADTILAFWDSESRGTKFTIDYSRKVGKIVTVIIVKK